MGTLSIPYMLWPFDGYDQPFRPPQRARNSDRRRRRRRTRPPKRFAGRARDRPDDLVAIIKAHARYFAEPLPVRLARSPLQPDAAALRLLAYYCRDRSSLLDDYAASRYADGLVALSAHARDWLRPIDAWAPPPRDNAAQFGSLVRHLLARYDLPAFLDAAWRLGLTADGLTQQTWVKLIGAGHSIRNATDLPLPLTKRMAHHFIQAPADFDMLAAFRYGQVLGLGGDERLARSLAGTRLGRQFEADDFWVTVVRWLIAHPDLPSAHHGAIIDYLHAQKFVPSMEGLGRGHPRLVPPRPHLCMKGRDPAVLLREVERWHRQLWVGRTSAASWNPCGISPFLVSETRPGGRRVYAVTELVSLDELEAEGAALAHCVAAYALQCQVGLSSIWSLTAEETAGQVERLLTVEVRNGCREIVQARGQGNRFAEPNELRVLAQWGQAGGPRLSPALTW